MNSQVLSVTRFFLLKDHGKLRTMSKEFVCGCWLFLSDGTLGFGCLDFLSAGGSEL
jgi:hypothetical protein